jgi:hypothetical protein
MLTAARQSPDPCDFALVAMLGLLGLRIFEATGADITHLGEEHSHRVLRVLETLPPPQSRRAPSLVAVRARPVPRPRARRRSVGRRPGSFRARQNPPKAE